MGFTALIENDKHMVTNGKNEQVCVTQKTKDMQGYLKILPNHVVNSIMKELLS